MSDSHSFLASRAESAGVADVHERVAASERLSAADGLRLMECGDLALVGALANMVRERLHGDRAYFCRNIRIDYTNACVNRCRFCAFSRLPGAPGAYILGPPEVEARLTAVADAGITEVHIVGGVNPALPFGYYLELLATVRRVLPDAHIKAFTAVEIAHIARTAGRPVPETLSILRDAGLGSCPGGGAEVLCERVHAELYPRKTGPGEWLEIHRQIHGAGLRSNATLLYGHIETPEERIGHLARLRELQDETGGFQAFVPLAFQPSNHALGHLPGTTGADDLRMVAVSRLMLDNIPHIKAYWVMLTPRVAQVALGFGADDIEGTVIGETIAHEAGATTPGELAVDELASLIGEAGRVPVERDSHYRVVREYGECRMRNADCGI